MIAPGVSSTISSTPVAVSSARMLRPSRPMIRPLRSSLGRSTTETVVSMACSAALRWMASATICWARTAAVSRASVSRRLTRLAASRRASLSSCRSSSSRASSARQPGDALELALPFRDAAPRIFASAGRHCFFPRRQRAFAAAQILLEPVALRSAGPRGRASCRRAAVRARASPRAARACAVRSRRRWRAPFRALRWRLPCAACRRRARPVSGASGC